MKLGSKNFSTAKTTREPSSNRGEPEISTLLMEILAGFSDAVVIKSGELVLERVGMVEEKGRELRDWRERERGEKWRRRREREGWPEVAKAESGGVKMVREDGKLMKWG